MNTRVAAFDDELTPDGHQPSPSRFSVDGVMQSLRNLATVSEALRILGAGVILVSMSVFLLQGWNDGNDIRRYLLLLAQTGLLGVAGLVMSHLVKETKGARLFFGLALVSIPANFTILGALLYSVFQWDGGLTSYPGYAEWRIDDIASIGLTMSAAMLVLVPVTLFCFAVMARQSARPLSLHFLLLNALLLLPIRGSMAAGTIALAGVMYALYRMRGMTRQNPALKTPEGKFALATLFIPLGIILFRSMYFYSVDSLMIVMVGLVAFLALRQTSQFPGRDTRVAFLLELISWPIALVVSAALTDVLAPSNAAGLAASVFSLSIAGLSFDIARRTESTRLATVVTGSVSLFVSLSMVLAVMFEPTSASAIAALLAGALLLFWGASGRRPLTAVAGVITIAAGASFGFDALVRMVFGSSWIELAIFGASAIALGSLIDRHGVAIRHRVSRWYNGRDSNGSTALENQQLG
ncbi:MAG: hypothetical protein AAGF72_01920 [Pseudomonadota bacterium]